VVQVAIDGRLLLEDGHLQLKPGVRYGLLGRRAKDGRARMLPRARRVARRARRVGGWRGHAGKRGRGGRARHARGRLGTPPRLDCPRRNGVGKSTLLRVMGERTLIGFPKHLRVCYGAPQPSPSGALCLVGAARAAAAAARSLPARSAVLGRAGGAAARG
jgi:hypothetical protein